LRDENEKLRIDRKTVPFSIVGEVVGHRGVGGCYRIIVLEAQTKRFYELDRFSAITPVDPGRSLIEYMVTENDYIIIDGKRRKICG